MCNTPNRAARHRGRVRDGRLDGARIRAKPAPALAPGNPRPQVRRVRPLKVPRAGEGVGDIPTLEVVDSVMIPKDLPAGEWVISWRWDCEESTQVWNSCADVTIKH